MNLILETKSVVTLRGIDTSHLFRGNFSSPFFQTNRVVKEKFTHMTVPLLKRYFEPMKQRVISQHQKHGRSYAAGLLSTMVMQCGGISYMTGNISTTLSRRSMMTQLTTSSQLEMMV